MTAADPSTSSAILSPPKSDEQPGIESVRRRIIEASENSEIVTALRLRRDLRAFAEEVDQLIRRLADEPDEPQPDTGSLKLLARAALADNRLRTLYCLALDGEGHVHAEWHFSRAKLFMTFRPTGHAKIVVVHPGGVGEAPLRVAGSLYSPRIESFTKCLSPAFRRGIRPPDDHHVVRYCSKSRLGRDGLPTLEVFDLREGESYLSAFWLEYFEDTTQPSRIDQVRQAAPRAGLTLTKGGRLPGARSTGRQRAGPCGELPAAHRPSGRCRRAVPRGRRRLGVRRTASSRR